MAEHKIAYIHGRPGPHPMHAKFAESVGGESHFVDFKMRWQDKDRTALYRLVSWIVCAFTFPNKKKYDIFLVDNLHFFPVLMKMFGLLKKHQKIVVHLGSHTLYFMYANRFSRFTNFLHKQALLRYDALICEGKMAEELAKKILGNKVPPVFTVINGIPSDHFTKQESPALNQKKILFMGHGPGNNRAWYKGLDLMIEAFTLAHKKNPSLSFTIIGIWDTVFKSQLLGACSPEIRQAINFVGPADDLKSFVKSHSLYLHTARGEAFGLTILIAMAHGLPPIISEWTGAKEVVEQADNRLIVPLDAAEIAKKIDWYFKLSEKERQELSGKCIEKARPYTEDHAVSYHQEIFSKMLQYFYK